MKSHQFFAIILIATSLHSFADEGDLNPVDPAVDTAVDPATNSASTSNNSSNNSSDNEFNNGLGHGIGYVIGEKIAQDIVNKMSPTDQREYLNKQRAILKSKMLEKYALGEYSSTMYGSIQTLRDGSDSNGHICKEYEVDLVVQLSRLYFTNTACLIGENWVSVDPLLVRFNQSGSRGPLLPGEGGNWLPPND